MEIVNAGKKRNVARKEIVICNKVPGDVGCRSSATSASGFESVTQETTPSHPIPTAGGSLRA